MKRLPRVRHIKPETIVLGDLLRVTSKHQGIETARVGRAVERDYQGSETVYYTVEGGELLRYARENSRSFVVTLIEPSIHRGAEQAPLFTI